ncbi:hypothetical protein O181_069044 [Austropuccinia psidii MF-1]|uniref:Uncharacterized protein n=1 Tax=Austropuccinia psidii MF-1 TaxID=1389203 RepID=A0A9Q3I855_9BASI|nr:hypothetical protein [Austropuccinia psidii MF-1]
MSLSMADSDHGHMLRIPTKAIIILAAQPEAQLVAKARLAIHQRQRWAAPLGTSWRRAHKPASADVSFGCACCDEDGGNPVKMARLLLS